MTTDWLPIIRTLRRHKIAAGLIVAQIALTFAIVSNAAFLIALRFERIGLDSGLPEADLVLPRVSQLFGSADPDALTRADLQALRRIPGVTASTVINQMIYGPRFSSSGVRLEPDEKARSVEVARYTAAEDWLPTLGLRMVAGRDFAPDEYQDLSFLDKSPDANVPVVIINQALAQRLFPGASAIGKLVYVQRNKPSQVVGVLAQLQSPRPGASDDPALYSMLFPIRPSYRTGRYVVRAAPGQQAAVSQAVTAALRQSDGQRMVREPLRLADMRSDYYRQDRNMAWLLGGVCLALLVVTAFGIVGLASFWVQQRTRMIGTRRALGATRGHILRYFQAENFLLSALGVAIGSVAAYAISALLVQHYELPRLPWTFLPLGAAALWALGQLAVLVPARRAAALPPVVALRGA